jgi:hypothetical protein
MNRRWMTAVLTAFMCAHGASLWAQGTGSHELPHAFPREGATQVFDNSWITAWDDTWIPNKPTAMHRHLYDYFGVELTDSRTRLLEPDSQSRTLSLRRGQSWFLAKGATHLEIGLSTHPPRRAILVDLKDTPSPLYENATRFSGGVPADGALKVVDNQRVIMWDRTWDAGLTVPLHFYERNVFVIFVDGGELMVTTPDEPPQVSSFATGQVLFLSGGHARALQATKVAVRAIVVELK